MSNCLKCGSVPKRNIYKYCSNKCQREFQYDEFIKVWKTESENGNNIVSRVNISRHIKRYLLFKYNNTCSSCGWGEKHPVTNSIPLEIDHIDGNAKNNLESNIRILCPNCHSLTNNFRNLNKGNGRMERRKKIYFDAL